LVEVARDPSKIRLLLRRMCLYLEEYKVKSGGDGLFEV
jgi:hypothetical protein